MDLSDPFIPKSENIEDRRESSDLIGALLSKIFTLQDLEEYNRLMSGPEYQRWLDKQRPTASPLDTEAGFYDIGRPVAPGQLRYDDYMSPAVKRD